MGVGKIVVRTIICSLVSTTSGRRQDDSPVLYGTFACCCCCCWPSLASWRETLTLLPAAALTGSLTLWSLRAVAVANITATASSKPGQLAGERSVLLVLRNERLALCKFASARQCALAVRARALIRANPRRPTRVPLHRRRRRRRLLAPTWSTTIVVVVVVM